MSALRRIGLAGVAGALIAGGVFWLERSAGGGGPHEAIELRAPRRRAPTPGLVILTGAVWRGHRRVSELVLTAFDPARFDVHLVENREQQALAELAPTRGLITNGAFFTPERTPTGLLVSKGKTLHPLIRRGGDAGSGVFFIRQGTAHVVTRDTARGLHFDDVAFAVQAGPRIIEPDGAPGIPQPGGSRAPRTFIGRTASGQVLLGAVTGGPRLRRGVTLHELQTLLTHWVPKAAPGLRPSAVLNLDGGTSTGLHARFGTYRVSHAEQVPVATAIVIRDDGDKRAAAP